MRNYSVKALLDELDRGIKSRYPKVQVEAEISKISVPASGHAYIELREPNGGRYAAILSAVCWRSDWNALKARPKAGDRVVARGRLGVFTGRGQVQLTVHTLEPAGQGDHARQIAERIARLQADGLLDPGRKRPLPHAPRFVGVATSTTGAALQDFLRVSGERFPAARILVAGCLTQGPEAPSSVARAVDLLLQDGRAEVIVITRGGGSAEDLLAYQDEQLARFLTTVPVPVVSAIGHEVDTSITDLVADATAPTPTAAALLVLPDGDALRARTDQVATALTDAMRRALVRRATHLQGLSARLRHPGERLAAIHRQADALQARLTVAMTRQLRQTRDRTGRAADALSPAVNTTVAQRRQRLGTTAGRLEALSPLAVLSRGYAVATGPRGLLQCADDVRTGDRVHVRLGQGAFDADVC